MDEAPVPRSRKPRADGSPEWELPWALRRSRPVARICRGGEFHPLATNAFSQQLGPLGPLISPLQQLIRHLQKATWHQKKEAPVTAAAARNFISCGKYIYFPEVLNNMVCNDNCRRCFPSHRATLSRHPFLFSDFP